MPKDLYQNICDKKVFKAIYNKYAKGLHSYLYYRYGEQIDPNDKVHGAFVRLIGNCEKLTLATARSFLYTAARNMALNEIKHRNVVLRHLKTKPKNYTDETPESIMERGQTNKGLQKALSKLPEKHRTALMLNKIEGKTHKEIAEIMGVSRKTIENWIYTALKTLKKELNRF